VPAVKTATARSLDRVTLIGSSVPKDEELERVEQPVNEVLTDDKSEHNGFVR
jgi:hypothetical protein